MHQHLDFAQEDNFEFALPGATTVKVKCRDWLQPLVGQLRHFYPEAGNVEAVAKTAVGLVFGKERAMNKPGRHAQKLVVWAGRRPGDFYIPNVLRGMKQK